MLGVRLRLHGLTDLLPKMVESQRKVHLEMGQDLQMRAKSILECPSCRLPQLSNPSLLLGRRGSGTQ